MNRGLLLRSDENAAVIVQLRSEAADAKKAKQDCTEQRAAEVAALKETADRKFSDESVRLESQWTTFLTRLAVIMKENGIDVDKGQLEARYRGKKFSGLCRQ